MKKALIFVGPFVLGGFAGLAAGQFTTNPLWVVFAGFVAGAIWYGGEHFIKGMKS
jgi:hypothetical protein